MYVEQSAISKDMNSEAVVLRQAASLASSENWKAAAAIIQEHQQMTSLSFEALKDLANYSSHAGDYDSAISLYIELTRLQPSDAELFYRLGFQYQQKEKWTDAIAAYTESARLSPRKLMVYLRLGDTHEKVGQVESALDAYRQGIKNYQCFSIDYKIRLRPIYAKFCTHAARLFLKKENRTSDELENAIKLLRKSSEIESSNADTWYSLGKALLDADLLDEALDCLQKAGDLDPKKEYVYHGIAKVHLKKNNFDEALKAYELIPPYKRSPYILDGMGQCYVAKQDFMTAARKFHQAIKREPKKFHHYMNLAQALIGLEAREQSIEALERANGLFREEHGKDYQKALKKIEEVRETLPSGKRVSFDDPSNITEIRFGTVHSYKTDRGFGFIKDETDGADVFFHISRVKERTAPDVGTRTKYIREMGEKGLQAGKVWLLGVYKKPTKEIR